MNQSQDKLFNHASNNNDRKWTKNIVKLISSTSLHRSTFLSTLWTRNLKAACGVDRNVERRENHSRSELCVEEDKIYTNINNRELFIQSIKQCLEALRSLMRFQHQIVSDLYEVFKFHSIKLHFWKKKQLCSGLLFPIRIVGGKSSMLSFSWIW